MALGAQDGTLLLLQVAALAIQMVGLPQIRFGTFVLTAMAFGTALILRRFPLQFPSVVIKEMMALAAILQACRFIMNVMGEHRRWTLGVFKLRVIHKLHILLRIGCGHGQGDAQQDRDK